MTPFDRQVRAQIYRELMAGGAGPSPGRLAMARRWPSDEVAESMRRLADKHLIALVDGEDRVWMAHPLSGVPTGYRALSGGRYWHANCAWDGLAVLTWVGDGHVEGPDGVLWAVEDGRVTPDGVVHLRVPASEFWDDIGFT